MSSIVVEEVVTSSKCITTDWDNITHVEISKVVDEVHFIEVYCTEVYYQKV